MLAESYIRSDVEGFQSDKELTVTFGADALCRNTGSEKRTV